MASVLQEAKLNPAQLEAAQTTEGPLLVLAGAGSGKTRVLTYRIAHMVADLGIEPYRILAITFTNKAAAEMRSRIHDLLGPTRGMWVLTFHALCVRMLRADAQRVGYGRDFAIYDDDDQKRLFKEIFAELGINPKSFSIQEARARISKAKNKLIDAQTFAQQATDSPKARLTAKVFERLTQRLMRANAMDFDDLLLYGHRLLAQNPDVLAAYQDRFTHISVDEYQDTNRAQFEIARLLADKNRNIMVVGDDDQSIYSWRGADIGNILNFEKRFPDARTIKLEQNYRSTGIILEAANGVIANNTRRKPKRLFTNGDRGDKIELYLATDERDEGRWIASQIERLVAGRYGYDDIAVFYRTNAQSRVLEDMFLRAGVPYQIVGGTRFFDRAEIRDVMAYLNLVVNPADDISAKRIINTPRRGIGKTTVAAIEAIASAQGIPFMQALQLACADESISAKARRSLGEFDTLIRTARSYTGPMRDVVEMIVEQSGLLASLEAQHTPEALSRVENIREFFGVVSEFEQHRMELLDDDDTAPTIEAGITQPVPAREALGAPGLPADPWQLAGADDGRGPGERTGQPSAAFADDDMAGLSMAQRAILAANRAVEQKRAREQHQAQLHAAMQLQAQAAESLPDADADAPLGTVPHLLEPLMEWLALRSDLDTMGQSDSQVTLMTVHSAKGLEFPVVFIAGMEEGIFPHRNARSSEEGIEEERRLAYVAITRARERLAVVCAQRRLLYGESQASPQSRFVQEIPGDCIEVSGIGSLDYEGTGHEKRGSRKGIYGSGTRYEQSVDALGYGSRDGHVFGSQTVPIMASANERPKEEKQVFAAGDHVDHKVFGRGVVVGVKGDELEVRFDKLGQTKKLLLGYAPIVKIQG